MLPYVEMRQYPRLIRDLVLNRRRRSRKQLTRFRRQFRHILGPRDTYRVSKSANSGSAHRSFHARGEFQTGLPAEFRTGDPGLICTRRFCDASHCTIVVSSAPARNYRNASELASIRGISCHHDNPDLDPRTNCHARDLDGCDQRRACGPSHGRGYLDRKCITETIAFFTAFLPQFVDPTRPAAHQIAVMCAVSALLAGLSDSCWAIASGLGRAWFMQPARAKLLGRVSGLTLIGGGMWLSLARRPAG
jgi:hypothetical protein